MKNALVFRPFHKLSYSFYVCGFASSYPSPENISLFHFPLFYFDEKMTLTNKNCFLTSNLTTVQYSTQNVKLLAAFGCFWLLLAAFGCFWILLLLSVFGCFQLHLAAFGCISSAFGCFWMLLAAFGSFWLLLAAFGCCWLLLAAFGCCSFF